ncbi:septal ring lytic transglycosylase RlpA family protein [Bosea sp. (in: a-proteobacteria)]|uniref:septal ring lytic transglycosylase RlpA family protein n=1 Tax=Bosea sp. (in: a-proteobacteria) TaxID=1871050 RepID=UPI002732389D|nr:septal ring lytic transglycosylase RlpA family protein [Bosea sp. (in: a-proteobacteria)]MDP3255961.1 septal ring lytic transglycosylase RlpA family protein [Bosea sp. (in: a-proteobacteria)]
MMRGARPSAPDTLSAATDPGSAPSSSSASSRAIRLGCVALAGLFLANCANDQVARRGKSKEIGAFPQAKYGPASPRVVAEGQEVPKGGGRQMIGKTYSVAGKRYTPYDKPVGYTAVGTASWYGEAFHGRKTANGEVYDRHGISAAHPTMPLPAYARVTNVLNNRSIIVRVNDRGPYHGGRVMDVSQKTAEALAFRHLGTARIKLEYLGQASLAGSDDKLLLATLRTDGQPAAIPGTSARTVVASSAAVGTARSRSADLDDQPDEIAPEPAPRAPQPAPAVAQAYAPQGFTTASAETVRTISPVIPVAASLVSTGGVPVRAAPLPPSRPFDLDTIANAATPVMVPAVLRQTLPPSRASVASLFAAPDRTPTQRFSASHPLDKALVPQNLQPLSSR